MKSGKTSEAQLAKEVLYVIEEVGKTIRPSDLKLSFCSVCLGAHYPGEERSISIYGKLYNTPCSKCDAPPPKTDDEPSIHKDWCVYTMPEDYWCCGSYCDGFSEPLRICARFKLDKFHLAYILKSIEEDGTKLEGVAGKCHIMGIKRYEDSELNRKDGKP